MELNTLRYMIYSFTLGLTVGTGILCFGLMVGRLQASGGVLSVFKREKVTPLEDIPGTEEYYDKARLAPEEGGHENPFEQDLVDLARHSE
jgi:hypothetical protein